MDYALVVDGSIERVGLPSSGRLRDGSTVSGFNLLDPVVLAGEGWLPIVEVRGEIADGQVWAEPVFAVADDHVTATYTAVDVPDGDGEADRYLAAEQARRIAYDATIAGKTKTLALLDAATKAGSDAYIAYLEAHPA